MYTRKFGTCGCWKFQSTRPPTIWQTATIQRHIHVICNHCKRCFTHSIVNGWASDIVRCSCICSNIYNEASTNCIKCNQELNWVIQSATDVYECVYQVDRQSVKTWQKAMTALFDMQCHIKQILFTVKLLLMMIRCGKALVSLSLIVRLSW